jgi:hypothetical protein
VTTARKSDRKKATKKSTRKTAASVKGSDFAAVFSALRGLLTPYEDSLALKNPTPGYQYLESRAPTCKNRPMYFAGVRTGKNYVVTT